MAPSKWLKIKVQDNEVLISSVRYLYIFSGRIFFKNIFQSYINLSYICVHSVIHRATTK